MDKKKKQIISNQINQILYLLKSFKNIDSHFNLTKSLKLHFRKNKFLGSRDRRFITNIVYTYFKWKPWADIIESPYKELFLIYFSKNFNERLIEYFKDLLKVKIPINDEKKFLNFIQDNSSNNLIETELFPKWMRGKIHNYHFFDLNSYFSGRAPIWIRIFNNKQTVLKEFNQVKSSTLIDNALMLATNTNVELSESYKTGKVEIQDLGSQMIIESLPLKNGMEIWDVCAGAGGKTISIAKKLNNNCKIFSTDIREHSLKELQKRAQRTSVTCVTAELTDVKSYQSDQLFDLILIDAPCSSSGTWRRNPAERWRLNENDYNKLLISQRRILNNAAKYLKTNSYLAYATCSFFQDENEEQIEQFLKNNKQYKLEKIKHPLKKDLSEEYIKSNDYKYNSDFMFVAVLKRIF